MTRPGFTLTELSVFTGIFLVLLTLVLINLIRPNSQASLTTTTNQLIADLKSQQLKAMSGDSDGSNSPSSYGVYIEATRYILFRGTSYSVSEPSNFSVSVTSPLSLSTLFPNSWVVFTVGSGEIDIFSQGQNTVTVTDSVSGQSQIIQLNLYGAITQE